MRPKYTLLLILAIVSVTFMTVLFSQKAPLQMACDKKVPCKKTCKETIPEKDSGGGDEMFSGSMNHLIVSTIR
jgi:hypothetical protein